MEGFKTKTKNTLKKFVCKILKYLHKPQTQQFKNLVQMPLNASSIRMFKFE